MDIGSLRVKYKRLDQAKTLQMYNLKEDNTIILTRVKIKKEKANVEKLILHVDFYRHLNNNITEKLYD